MDSDTHIKLGLRLLQAAGQPDLRAAAGSLFPQIDRQPAYFHRLFAHCFDQVPALVDASHSCGFWSGTPTAPRAHGAHETIDSSTYVENRLLAERSRIETYCSRLGGGTLQGDSAPPDVATQLCVVSHIYNDTFNNPVQAFAPYDSIPSGMWDLWDELGTLEFRRTLYGPERIAALQEEFFCDAEWEFSAPPEVLTAAMVVRVASRAAHAIDFEVWLRTLDGLGVAESLHAKAFREAVEFLAHQDQRLAELFLKFAR